MPADDTPPPAGPMAAAAVRLDVPNPRLPLPQAATPTALLFATSLALWCMTTWLAVTERAPLSVTIPIHALVTFTMFTVLHESAHHAAGKLTWANEVLGRLSTPFVAVYLSFPQARYIHLEHHRNTNSDPHADPAAWNSHGPWWQLPFRWLTVDIWYVCFYLRHKGRRPQAEVGETMALLALSLGTFAVLAGTGFGWDLLTVYLIPQRIGLAVLAWWFDWLPHHGLRPGAFGSTRVRVGLEWLMTPLMLYQNYHLVHHLHPAIPFYRYLKTWHANRESYLARDVPIITAWGRELTASEYREWARLTECYAAEPAPDPLPKRYTEFHSLAVTDVQPLAEDAVSVTFAVPDELRETFRFIPGQHVVVRGCVDGRVLRRAYSVCGGSAPCVLRIAIKRQDHGQFSTYANTALRPGDRLDVLSPAGRFTLPPNPRHAKHYVALAAGCGIAPIISMLSNALLVEERSRATLLYVNRSGASTMFAEELTTLARKYEGRLHVVHYRTDERDPDLHTVRTSRPVDALAEALAISHERYVRGRLTAVRLRALLMGRLHPAKVDDWFLCAPEDLTEIARTVLAEHDVPRENVHIERFTVDARAASVPEMS